MNFDLSPEQQAIKQGARDFLSGKSDLRAVRRQVEAGIYDDSLWTAVRNQGWTGIAVPEESGGAGLGFVEMAVVMEEFGYACAPSPLLSNSAAGILLGSAGSDGQKGRWLAALASGEKRGAVGTVTADGSAIVADAQGADLLVLVDEEDATLVEIASAQVEPVTGIDPTRRFFRVRADRGEALGGDVAGALQRIEVGLSAELVGVGQRAMEMAVEYAKQRQQFGRPIGAYQAVSHRCAEMLLEVESARSATYFAAWAAGADPVALPLAASVAKVAAAEMGWKVAASALQVHGGIGFTWEHDLHFFLKRAASDARMFGSASEHRDRVAGLSGLGLDTSRSAAPAPELATV
ncbi:MAG TPA: acyl-CoA dehydrogenase family protein [Candidatus Dormibacteraeota bacterium]|nr:acyl-CoA dehydrogenase family protein [Candidatus Dormibacteraeota bacterium]